jgi:hypothetical protein
MAGSFPDYKPSRRNVSLGDWPVKAVRAMSGAETRLRYGDRRSEATLDLYYEALTAVEADAFISHYNSALGTYDTFTVGTPLTVGWTSGSRVTGDAAWRYAEPPQFSSNAGDCDKLNVSIKLMTVV